MAVTIPDEFTNKGPQPFDPPFTFKASEAITTGALVSLATDEREVKMCDIGETPIGWAQASASADEQVDISLFGPVWRVDIDSGSDTISYGDIVEVANDGKVKKGAAVSPGVIVGLAIRGGAASGQALIIPIVSTPDPTT
jgi:hypothetical protein